MRGRGVDPGGRRLVRVGFQQGAAGGGECAPAGDPEHFGLGHGPASQPRAQVLPAGRGGAGGAPGGRGGTRGGTGGSRGGCAAVAGRPLPPQPIQQDVGDGRGTGREGGQEFEDPAADLGGRGAVQVRAERGEGAAPVVPAADQPRRTGRGQPGGGEPRPALLGGQPQPVVVGGGGGVALVGLAVGGHQPGRVGQLDPEGGHRLGHVECHGGPLEVADAQPARAQHGRSGVLPLPQQLLNGGQGGEGLTRGGVIHSLWIVLGGGRERRGQRLGGAVCPAVAQMQGDLAGQHDVARPGREQQSAVQQPADGRSGRGDGRLSVRRSPGQLGQHGRRAGRRPAQQRRHPGAVLEQLGQGRHRRDRVVGGRQPGARQQLLQSARRHPGRGLLDGRAETGRRGGGGGGREQFAGGADEAEAVVTAPDQGLVAQGGHGTRQLGGDRRTFLGGQGGGAGCGVGG
ncbi:hypothetical protein SANTM175S_00780 [Streptomyces antimycoticus]